MDAPRFFTRKTRAAQFKTKTKSFPLEGLESRVLLSANTYAFSSLHSFVGNPDGSGPFGGLTADGFGNYYGTTVGGGANANGTLFAILFGTDVALPFYSFSGTADGANPLGGVAFNSAGTLFGTTEHGGADNDGTVFEITTGITAVQTLYSFTGGADGALPSTTLTVDAQGDLFGSTAAAGAFGGGTIFEIPAGTSTPVNLHQFSGGTDGDSPYGKLLLDAHGNIFGTTFGGATKGNGTIFEILAGTSIFSPLHTFTGADGSQPTGALAMDGDGDIIGTTTAGGADKHGSIFEIAAGTSTLTTLYSFTGGADGATPYSGVVFNAEGDMFGTTYAGGAFHDGTVYEIPAGGTLTTLYAFSGGDGAKPYAPLLIDANGDLLGTTTAGGSAALGTVFELSPTNTTQIDIAQPPMDTVASQNIPPVVINLLNASDSLVANDNSEVTVSLVGGPAGATLAGTLTVHAHGGVATFSSLHLSKAGQYTLQFSDGTLDPAQSATFNILPGPATHLLITGQPSATIAGQTMSQDVVVEVLDAHGNIVTNDTSSVMLNLDTGTTPTIKNLFSAQAVNGIATFESLVIDKAGTFTLAAADGKLAGTRTKTFAISPDVVFAQLTAFLLPPSSVIVGKPLAPHVVFHVTDEFGNVITTDHSSVTLSIVDGPAGGTLSGVTTVTAVHGVATFTNPLIALAGDYTLLATDATLPAGSAHQFTQTIAQGTTTLAAPPLAATSFFGRTLTLVTTLKSNAPATVPFTGSVTLSDTNNDLLPTVAVGRNGQIKIVLTNLPPEDYVFTLSYPGDANHTAVMSRTFSVDLKPAVTSTSLKASISDLGSGQSLTLTAVVKALTGAGTARTGTVTLEDNGIPLQMMTLDVNSSATLVIVAPTAGPHHFTAVYSGDSNFAADTSPKLNVTVKAPSVGVPAALNSALGPVALDQLLDLGNI